MLFPGLHPAAMVSTSAINNNGNGPAHPHPHPHPHHPHHNGHGGGNPHMGAGGNPQGHHHPGAAVPGNFGGGPHPMQGTQILTPTWIFQQ